MEGKRLLSGVLAFLICSLTVTPTIAYADTAKAEEILDAISECKTDTSHDINEDTRVSLRDALAALDPDSVNAESTVVIAQNEIAACAGGGRIRFIAEQPLASDPSPDKVKITYSSGAQIKAVAVNKISNTEFTVDFEGKTTGGEGTIRIGFDRGFFADRRYEGISAAFVSVPSPYFEEADGGYDRENELFTVYVDLGSAQLSETPDPSDFIFPYTDYGYNLAIMGIDGNKGDSDITLKIKVNGGTTAEERFDALDNILTNGGIIVTERSINCSGSLRIADRYPNDYFSALHHARSVPMAYAVITGISEDRKTAEAEIYLDSVNGSVDIRNLDYDFCDLDVSSFDSDEIKYIDVEHMDSHVLKSVSEDVNCITIDMPIPPYAEGTEEQIIGYAKHYLADMHLHINSGMLNGWGIEETDQYADIIVLSEDRRDELRNNIFPTGKLRSMDDPNPADIMTTADAATISKTTLGYLKEALSTGAKIASLFAKNGMNLTNGLGLASAVIGMISNIISDAAGGVGQQVTMVDLKKQMDAMENTLADISSDVKVLAKQLEDMSKKNDFTDDYTKVSEHISNIDNLKETMDDYYETINAIPEIRKEVNNVEELKDVMKKCETSEDPNTKAIMDARKELIEEYSGYITMHPNPIDSTLALGKAIIGDESVLIVGDSIFRKYFDFIDTCFNWEPETYDYKEGFMCRVLNAYVRGYNFSMAVLQYLSMDESLTEGERKIFEREYERLANQIKEVYTAAFGSDKHDERNIEGFADKIRPDRRYNRKDGVLNLVNHRVYTSYEFTTYTFIENFYKNDSWEKPSEFNVQFNESVSDLTEDVIKEMSRRLKIVMQKKGVKTLGEEICSVDLENDFILAHPRYHSFDGEKYGDKKHHKMINKDTYARRIPFIVYISEPNKYDKDFVLHERKYDFGVYCLADPDPERILIPDGLDIKSKRHAACYWERTLTIETVYTTHGKPAN